MQTQSTTDRATQCSQPELQLPQRHVGLPELDNDKAREWDWRMPGAGGRSRGLGAHSVSCSWCAGRPPATKPSRLYSSITQSSKHGDASAEFSACGLRDLGTIALTISGCSSGCCYSGTASQSPSSRQRATTNSRRTSSSASARLTVQIKMSDTWISR